MQVFEEMKAAGEQPNVVTYSALISAYEKGAQWELARDLFEAMKAARVQPDVITYSAPISAYEKAAQWELARDVFAEMNAAGVQPDVKSYSALVSAYEKGAQWPRAEIAFAEMKAAGVQPDVVRGQGLHSGCPFTLRCTRETSSTRWVGLGLHRSPSARQSENATWVRTGVQVTYNSLISAYGNGEQYERAEAAFDEMKAAGVKPDAASFSALIGAYEKAGQDELAREVRAEMKAL